VLANYNVIAVLQGHTHINELVRFKETHSSPAERSAGTGGAARVGLSRRFYSREPACRQAVYAIPDVWLPQRGPGGLVIALVSHSPALDRECWEKECWERKCSVKNG